MLDNGKINTRQLTILVVLFCLGSTILIVPSSLTSIAKQDGWIAAIVGIMIGMLMIIIYVKLANRYPEQSLVQFSEWIVGKWAGKLIGLLYFGYFFILAALVLRNVGDFITTIVMPETPIQAVHLLFLVIIIMGVTLGIEVCARTAEIFFPWILFLIVSLVIFLLPQMKWERIQPVWEVGSNAIVHGSLSVLGIPYMELVVFLMIYPAVSQQKMAGKAFMKGAMFAGIIIVLITVLCILVLGWDFTSRHAYPSYTLAKKIHFGEFLQRIEVLMAVIWMLTIFFKLALCFYVSVLSLAQVLRLSTYRPLIMPLALNLIVLSLVVYPNLIYFKTFVSEIWVFYALTFGFVLPALLLMISSFQKRKGEL